MSEIDLRKATERAMEFRRLYKILEERHHGSEWTAPELMTGFTYDVGLLGQLIMAKEGRWMYKGDTDKDLENKLSECLWWILVLAERQGIDLSKSFSATMDEFERDLGKSVEG